MVECTACHGRYESTNRDGTLYFHVCPPLSAPELALAVAKGTVVLPGGETPDVAVTRRVYERATKRDENVPSTAIADTGAVKAAGLGVTPVAAPAPAVVIVG